MMNKRPRARRIWLRALRIAAFYVLLAGFWIVTSDEMLRTLFPALGPDDVTELQTLKGLGFVLVTAALLFLLVRRDLIQVHSAQERESAEALRLKHTLSRAGIGTALLDGHHIVTDTAGPFEDILGIAPGRSVGTPLSAVLAEAGLDTSVVRLLLEPLASQDHSPSLEVELERAGEEARAVVRFSAVRLDAQVAGPAMLILVEDVSDLSQALGDRERYMERYRTVFEAAPIPMWVFEAETLSIVDVNHAAIHAYGYSRTQFLSMDIEQIRPKEDVPALRAHMEGDEAYSARQIWRHLRSDGGLLWARVHAADVVLSGRRCRLITAEDVTEQLEAESSERESRRLYEATLANIQDAVCVVDRRTDTIVSVNPAVESILGHAPSSLVGQRPQRLHVDEDHARRFREESEAALREGRAYRGEFRLKHRDGHIVETEHHVALIPELEGRDWAVSVIRDISDRKRRLAEAEELSGQLRSLSRELMEVSERERRHLSAELHDDVGQRLISLSLELDRVSDRGEPERERLDLARQLLAGAMNSVRELALDLRPAVLDDLGLEAAVRWMVQRELEPAGLVVELETEALQELPPQVSVTAYRMLQESVQNVLKHAEASTLQIVLRCVDGELRICVRDDGVGFDLKASSGRSDRRRGLGITTLRERAWAGGGDVEISSDRDGTEIEIRLPLDTT